MGIQQSPRHKSASPSVSPHACAAADKTVDQADTLTHCGEIAGANMAVRLEATCPSPYVWG